MKMKTIVMITVLLLGSAAALADTYYVSTSGTHTSPFASWVSAATNIQDATGIATNAGDVVLVTNGTYAVTAEVAVAESVRVEGVGGSSETIVVAVNSNRCFYLDKDVFLSGFTITNGYSSGVGGGILCADESPMVSNCIFRGNMAGSDGGAMYGGRVFDSSLIGNTAAYGGAIWAADLYNCVVYSNTATIGGGGMYVGTARNSIFWSNSAPSGSNLYYNGSILSCHIADPLFVDAPNADFHLQTTSPCIDAGSNALAYASSDFDGIPRPLDGDTNGTAIIDIGCYEVLIASADSDGDAMPDGYEIGVGHDPTTDDAAGNPDADPHGNLAEYIAGTDPTNAASYFAITNAMETASGFVVEWAPSVGGREYTLLHESSLTNGLTNLVAGIEWPQNSATDTVHSAETEGFYRMEVELK